MTEFSPLLRNEVNENNVSLTTQSAIAYMLCWARFVIIDINRTINFFVFISLIQIEQFDRGRSQINTDLIMLLMSNKRPLLNPPASEKIPTFFLFFFCDLKLARKVKH